MRFVIDANLPPRLATFLVQEGHEAQHVGSPPLGLDATDVQIASWADSEEAVVVTKDGDFRSLQLATGCPAKVLLIATGNISTPDLLAVLEPRLDPAVRALAESARCVEIHRTGLVVVSEPDADG